MTVEVVFSHSGSMFAYYLGIAEVLQDYDLTDVEFSGTSGGCFPCILLNSGRNIREFFDTILDFIKDSEGNWQHTIKEFLTQYITDEDIEKNQNKFHCKLTKLNQYLLPEKVVVNSWKDKQDFIDCIVAACYVPIMSGGSLYLDYRGQKIIDGFFSGTSSETVTNNESILFYPNKWRYTNPTWMLPSNDVQWLKALYELGYNDALQNIEDINQTLKMNKEKELETQNDSIRQSE
jgi:hypothetical protein